MESDSSPTSEPSPKPEQDVEWLVTSKDLHKTSGLVWLPRAKQKSG